MKYIVLLLLIGIKTVAASEETPYDKFSTSHNFTNKSSITWLQSDDVIGDCDRESKRNGGSGFSYKVEACSFWSRDPQNLGNCTIITAHEVSMWTLGHEVLHCFQGRFH